MDHSHSLYFNSSTSQFHMYICFPPYDLFIFIYEDIYPVWPNQNMQIMFFLGAQDDIYISRIIPHAVYVHAPTI